MYFRAIAGLVAGLCAGVVSGIMFLLMRAPAADGMAYSLLAVISRAAGSNDPAVGWSYHLFNLAILGVIFGVVVGRYVDRLTTAIPLGLASSLASWALANLLLLPRLHEETAYAGGNLLSPFGVGTLIGYVVAGILLGVIYLWVYNPIRIAEYKDEAAQETPDENLVGAQSGQPKR